MPSFYYYDQNPSEFCFFANDGLSLCTDAPYDGFCYLNLAGIGKFKYERKNEKDSGRNTVEPRLTMMVALKELHSVVKKMPLFKWPIPKSNWKWKGTFWWR